jgi:hypothetical protein
MVAPDIGWEDVVAAVQQWLGRNWTDQALAASTSRSID